MEQEPDWAADDPEIAALLNFTPVERRIVRGDGWSPALQRGFIAWLARCGDVAEAARAVERSESGAKLLRKEDVAGEFKAAWDGALALHRRRRSRANAARAEAHAARARGERVLIGSELDMAEEEKEELLDEILERYLVKIQAERNSRLEGRIVEADYYVRQLTCIELVLDIGGRTQELLNTFRQGDLHLVQLAATPGSSLLEKVRRAVWQEKGEADRPPPAPLGRHNEQYATGREHYDPERDGDRRAWERRQEEKRRLAAEAQAEWEARARREAGNDNDNDDPDAVP
jgi:hypothetical protein